MTLRYDLYWSFRSPYSYLVTPRLLELEAEYDVACNVRPVFPLAVRTPEFFDRADPLYRSHLVADVTREAAFLGMPFRIPPRPDPVQQEKGNYRVAQPYIHRLTYLGVAAAELGRGLQFLREVSHIVWSGEVDNWHEDDHLARAAERAGLDLSDMDAAVAADNARFEKIVNENQVAHRAAGHWGVPAMAFNGEIFFGQDRFNQLKWRMEAKGLARRR
jgi:2-hydroxychromene-2-carboxylate isomerase